MSKSQTPDGIMPNNPVALIAGPTASGKSAIALGLADARKEAGLSTIIINADSMQIYRDIPVLSAAPEVEESIRHPHRLYGAWDAAEACSAASWAEKARQEIEKAHSEGALPVLVGGTGMYIRVLLDGIAPIPAIDPKVRDEVRALPVDAAYACLQIEDPGRASLLAPNDSQRIARALEVVRSTGTTLSDWQQAKTGGIGEDIELHPVIMLPDREWLYERCDSRFVQMTQLGAIEEVEALLERNLSPDLPAMRAIGVPEIAACLRGEISNEEMIERGQQSTRNYAKRQYTWFRRQTPTDWVRVESQNVDAEAQFASILRH
ncbi:MAG: tRNA (adenosine(37)-N6)-dimethylallyltransferase MiaA [Pseudomonadota bacterium]